MGLRPIRDIEPGDRVWSFNFTSGEWQLAEASGRHEQNWNGSLHTITTDRGSVELTPNHPFCVVRGDNLDDRVLFPEVSIQDDRGGKLEGRWVDAFDVRAGDTLYLRGHGETLESQVSVLPTQIAVHTITVNGLHSFAVGSGQVLVHNTSGSKG